MATVPGDPNENVRPMLPKEFQPTMADFLQAAHITTERQRVAQSDDYDYAAAAAAGVKPDERGHMPDTYKLPNHITFSDESIHDDGGAGHWEKANGKWSFTPGPTNLKHHSIDELRDYFKKYEPDSTLIEPKGR